jgi:hypothetical protein
MFCEREDPMTLELIPLCTATVTPAPAIDLGTTPSGRRIMVTILDSIWEGDRLRARQKPGTAAADWLTIAPDGTGMIDIRLTLETHDGALIYVAYQGRRDFSEVEQGIDAPVYIAPLFETSDRRYAWLNKIQAVGKGTVVDESRVYEIFEVR